MRGFLLCCVGGALGLDVILPPSAPRRGGDVALLIAPAANASFVPAQYAQLGREYMVPTIQVRPDAVAVPESFRQLRRLIGFNASAKNGTHLNATGARNGTKVFIGESSIKALV